MAWRENLLPAALDDVPFLYEEIRTEVGRRGEVHQFPGRDEPFAEDLGREARTYGVRAFVIGPLYMDARDALTDVLEAGGEHIFTHPYKGDFKVKLIGKASIRETDQQGGMAQFDFTLVESGLEFPLVRFDTKAKVKKLAANAMDKLAKKTKFNLLNAIGDVLASIANGLNAAASAIAKVNGKIDGALSLVDNITDAIDNFTKELTTLMNTPTALMTKLGALVDSLQALVTGFLPEPPPLGIKDEFIDLVGLSMETTKELFAFTTEATVIPTPTAQSEIEVDGHAAVENEMKGAALASGVAATAELELESADQAQQLLKDFTAMFETVLAADVDPEVYDAFAALKAAVVEHFAETAKSLPQLTTYTPPATTPALVIAYELYGDASMDEDLVRRNKVKHPLFVQGGVPLEVLTSG